MLPAFHRCSIATNTFFLPHTTRFFSRHLPDRPHNGKKRKISQPPPPPQLPATTDFTYTVLPERLQEIAKSPTGWVPPMDPAPDLPFYVRRTRYNNIPVYCVAKGGGKTKKVTYVAHVQGDLKALERCIRDRIGDNYHYQVNELTQKVKVKGDFAADISRLLKELGL